jgi:hypothetical protein
MVGRPEPAEPVTGSLADDPRAHTTEAVAKQDVVDAAVERPADLAQVVSVTAGQPDVVGMRLRPRILEARVDEVRMRRRGGSVGA